MSLVELLLVILVFLVIFCIYKIHGIDSRINSDEIKNLYQLISLQREENSRQMHESRLEINQAMNAFTDATLKRLTENVLLQNQHLENLTNQIGRFAKDTIAELQSNSFKLEQRFHFFLEENSRKLEQMRQTVDEKLQSTLERRLSESFQLVSERLELVYKGLGEMQALANGVGDLKKVLTNVKTKGLLGEYQLEAILEQLLSPEQYVKNINPNPHQPRVFVEFAIKIPSKEDTRQFVYLPIDAKFPTEDYQALLYAYESANADEVESKRRNLYNKIKLFAKEIKDKYISPPFTTDFAIMFLPSEGLYAEVLRLPMLFEQLQREFRVTIAGPTTLAALLNSLQMGFRTLTIQQRTSEVWQLLENVKTEFSLFGELLTKTQQKLLEATSTLEKAGARSKAIEKKLKEVQLPAQKEENLPLDS
ncbi:MAG: DNA recombination protein RmuC [Cytophagales bacterium]|nr:DNA recombination protein RmuC [Cytophagales bacterium]MDW8383258.1 DNA recombination protein RmuC [Flammeovirgaceae bacterium]